MDDVVARRQRPGVALAVGAERRLADRPRRHGAGRVSLRVVPGQVVVDLRVGCRGLVDAEPVPAIRGPSRPRDLDRLAAPVAPFVGRELELRSGVAQVEGDAGDLGAIAVEQDRLVGAGIPAGGVELHVAPLARGIERLERVAGIAALRHDRDLVAVLTGIVPADRDLVADVGEASVDRDQRRHRHRADVEGREHRAVVGGPGRFLDVDVLAAGLADELAVERLRRPRGVDVVDPLAGALLGDPGHRDGVVVDLAVAVAEAVVEERLADWPRDRLGDLLAGADRFGRVVEAGRLVEVTG